MLGYSEICDFVGPFVDEYVLRFNIAMDDVGVMEDLITPAELLEEIPYFRLRHELCAMQNGL